MKVIVGLGNSGPAYDNTRHNIGFRTVDTFAENSRHSWRHEGQMSAFLIKISREHDSLLLVKPDGFMNDSGGPVSKICSFYKIPPQEVCVVCDEITLELGDVKLTQRTGTAGHNGVKDILKKLGPGFLRFRVGIGKKTHPTMDLAAHVLGKFSDEDLAILNQKLPDICNNLQLLLDKGISSAMNEINRKICKPGPTEQP